VRANEFIDEEIIDEWSENHPGIKQELKKKGYKFLGLGVDQMAFLEPGTGYVLKIFGTQEKLRGRPDDFSEDHKMFFIFAEFCMKNKDNPFLPKFFGYESFVYDNKNYLQIRQEKLRDSGEFGFTVENLGDSLRGTGITPDEMMRNAEARMLRTQNDAFGSPDDPPDFPDAEDCIDVIGSKATLQLLVTLEQLILMGEEHGWGWDLHNANIMRRGKIPVLVDPWVAGSPPDPDDDIY